MDNYDQSNLNIVQEDEPLELKGTQKATGEEKSTGSHEIVDDVTEAKSKGCLATDISRVESKA